MQTYCVTQKTKKSRKMHLISYNEYKSSNLQDIILFVGTEKECILWKKQKSKKR